MKQNFKKGGFNCFFIILCKIHEKFLFSLCFIFQTFLIVFWVFFLSNKKLFLRNHK
ncbi:Hypothetical protein HP17_04236 [Helicobacter pylori NCTC 11637 = CCUG 17874 = ATCC 43504 = JCM 12093]|nr:Hypothetical protein HP17_04236 [Helicobacter pylori NCTC 11637 = CCUG 17874 = ATCC 43504 = JCM 12093]